MRLGAAVADLPWRRRRAIEWLLAGVLERERALELNWLAGGSSLVGYRAG
jgi:hypothetical protein